MGVFDYFRWFGPSTGDTRTSQEMKGELDTLEEVMEKAIQPKQEEETWTDEDQRELDKLEADHKFQENEKRQKYFMSLPEDIRTCIVEAWKQQAVQLALSEMDKRNIPFSHRLSDLYSKKHRLQRNRFGSTGMLLKSRNDNNPQAIDIYDELSKLHAEASTREIIVDDK